MTTQAARVLGISALFHDSAAALVDGNIIEAAAQEERFTRKKGDWQFPSKSIDYCKRQLRSDQSIDAIAFYENPLLKLDRFFGSACDNYPRGALNWPQMLRTTHDINSHFLEKLRKVEADPARIFFTTHHRAHAASAFYPSPFEKAAILVVDGVGEWASTSIWRGDQSGLELLSEVRFPHSLGLFYSAFTQYCGFKVNSGEYKLMGLAPFGEPVFKQRIMSELIDIKSDGSYKLNLQYFAFHTALSTINPLFEDLFGFPARHPDEPINKHYMDVAASAQEVINDAMVALASAALRKAGVDTLCMAGGVALNCVANTNILRRTNGLQKMWVQPAAGDAGGALGAALDVAQKLSSKPGKSSDGVKKDSMRGSYLGPEYNTKQIESALKKWNLVFEHHDTPEQAIGEIVDLLSSGNIVGHFFGRMEFGPRALGNRSILADPRPPQMLNDVNIKIKFREGWRPFAPVITEELAGEYFQHPVDSPYMLMVTSLLDKYQTGRSLSEVRSAGVHDVAGLQNGTEGAFSAISHVDGSSRLQSVSQASNPRLHGILQQFYERTGCPMLLNTSFNVRGEPIVCSPDDAVRCFINTNLDVLVLDGFVVRKSMQRKVIQEKAGKVKFNAD